MSEGPLWGLAPTNLDILIAIFGKGQICGEAGINVGRFFPKESLRDKSPPILQYRELVVPIYLVNEASRDDLQKAHLLHQHNFSGAEEGFIGFQRFGLEANEVHSGR